MKALHVCVVSNMKPVLITSNWKNVGMADFRYDHYCMARITDTSAKALAVNL